MGKVKLFKDNEGKRKLHIPIPVKEKDCHMINDFIKKEMKMENVPKEVIDNFIFFDYTITKLTVNEQGIATRQRVADQHVAVSKQTMDKLLTYFVQERILDNKVNLNV